MNRLTNGGFSPLSKNLTFDIYKFVYFLGTLTMPPSTMDKSKDWQLEILMEKLRSKSSQFKSLAEISKNVRMAMLVGYVICTVDGQIKQGQK
jgi:hypothetical protein